MSHLMLCWLNTCWCCCDTGSMYCRRRCDL